MRPQCRSNKPPLGATAELCRATRLPTTDGVQKRTTTNWDNGAVTEANDDDLSKSVMRGYRDASRHEIVEQLLDRDQVLLTLGLAISERNFSMPAAIAIRLDIIEPGARYMRTA